MESQLSSRHGVKLQLRCDRDLTSRSVLRGTRLSLRSTPSNASYEGCFCLCSPQMLVDHDDSRESRSMNASPTVVQTVWAEIRRGARIALASLADSKRIMGRPLPCQWSAKDGPDRERRPSETYGVKRVLARLDGRLQPGLNF